MNLNCERESYVHEILDANYFLSNDSNTLLSMDSTSSEEKLHNLKLIDPNRLMLVDLNIISVKKKFDLLEDIRNKT